MAIGKVNPGDPGTDADAIMSRANRPRGLWWVEDGPVKPTEELDEAPVRESETAQKEISKPKLKSFKKGQIKINWAKMR